MNKLNKHVKSTLVKILAAISTCLCMLCRSAEIFSTNSGNQTVQARHQKAFKS